MTFPTQEAVQPIRGNENALFQQFAWFDPYRTPDALQELVDLAEEEDWIYHHTDNPHHYPILHNYLRFTYPRLFELGQIAVTENEQYSCFNTGLVTPLQEPIFAFFFPNKNVDRQKWYFVGWRTRAHYDISRNFQTAPEMATYFDEPSDLVFDANLRLDYQSTHIISNEVNRARFPERYAEHSDYELLGIFEGAVKSAIERARRNYKTAIPQFYRGRIQLLLPLCFSDPQKADLAIVVERHGGHYRASTCLTLDMAYNNARLLAKPDKDWLQP